jgi:hypothetical protein
MSSQPPSIPTTVPVPVTQEAPTETTVNTLPQSISTNSTGHNANVKTASTNDSTTINITPEVDPDTISSVCSLLHHEDKTHYILTRFCLPVPTEVDPNNPPLCKYGKKIV